MARAHFSSRKDFNKLTESPPAPSPVEVDVETEEKEATDPASQLANLAALLQSAHSNQGGINDIVGAMLSSNQGTNRSAEEQQDLFRQLLSNRIEDQQNHNGSQQSEQQEQQAALEQQDQQDGTKSNATEWIDQATAASALQMLSETEEKENDKKMDNVMLVANYPGLSNLDLRVQTTVESDDGWTAEQDELLIAGIKKYGYGRWKEIAEIIPGRKTKELKQRWDNHLAHKYIDSDWLQSKLNEGAEHIDVDGSAPQSPDNSNNSNDNDDNNGNSNHEAIEALLSQALLGTFHNNSSSSSSSTPEPSPNEAAPLNFATEFALYAQQLHDKAASNPLAALANHPFFFSQPNTAPATPTNDNAAAVAAAVAAMAQSQQPGYRSSLKPAPRAGPGQKRRRSDPALAETQSDAMSIYASAAPITTTINNQTQTVYPCLFPNCGKTFARLYNLKSHSRTHTDDRPFVCPICDTAFSRNHDLKRHSKIHGGDKPHICHGCNKTFSRLDALKRHKSNQRNKGNCLNA